jgi:DUF1680 family protein
MDRRNFAKSAALFPLGLVVPSALVSPKAWSKESSQPNVFEGNDGPSEPVQGKKTDKEYNRHQPINEGDPFADPIAFSRNELKLKVQPFALSEVTLEEGVLQRARDWNRGYMMRLPNDRLLYNFRMNAGLPSNAEPLGGWESPSSELRGHFVGHYLSATALLYAGTQDESVLKKANNLVAGIAECQDKLALGGYVSAFPEELFNRLDRRETVWAPFYTIHKILAGMLDMHRYAGSQQALDVAIKLAGWVDAWTAGKSEEHMQDILNTEYGGMNDALYTLASITADDRWARTGDRFTKKVFFNPLAMRQDKLKGLHANTHMPQVIGAAARFDLSSDSRFKDVAEFFWETIAESRTYAAGGSGNTESWLTNANRLSLEMKASSHHQECCCAYNMMKLTRQLFSWSGNSRYIDYYERNLFNHRIGMIEPETGLTSYFLSMSPGAWKTTCTEDRTFWCCTGTGLEDFAKLNDTIYYHNDNDVYVNLFVSSHLHWKDKGIHIQQTTAFPDSNHTLLVVENTPDEEWTMHLRVPSWTTTKNSLRVNGQQTRFSGQPGSYITITRSWKPGDRVEFVVPMRLKAEPLADDPTQQAFLYGPIVLAAQFPRGDIDDDLKHNQGPEIQEAPRLSVPGLESRGLPVDRWLVPAHGEPLTFRTSGQAQDIIFKPLNQSWQRFAVYLRVT